MECHEGAAMIKSFRGLIVDEGQDTIVLHTNDGSTGYRLVKFEVMLNTPGKSGGAESIVKVYKVSQTTVDGVVDFSDNTLLAAAYYVEQDTAGYPLSSVVIFDGEIFNQDIYVTNIDVDGAHAMNYYMELEQIKLDLSESTVATLKDIRNETRIAAGLP